MKLNLGCSDDFKPGYVNVDRDRLPPENIPAGIDYRAVDLSGSHSATPWPWPESSVDEIIAHDVFEHIWNPVWPGQLGIIYCMNEAWRVLKPGGILDLVVPCLPGVAPFCDPTHVQVWTSDHRYYFDERWNNQRGERGRLGPAYGIKARFATLPLGWASSSPHYSGIDWTPINYAKGTDRHKLFLLLQAVK